MDSELTIADIAIAPWIKGLDWYDGHTELATDEYPNVLAYRDRFYNLPAAQRGASVGA
jgi:GST-like protein